MDGYVAENVGEEVDKVEKDTSKEVVEEATTHTKVVLTYQMLPITLKIQIGIHSKTRHKK